MTGSAFSLCLADGTRLALCAGDPDAARVVDFLARAVCLSPAPDPLSPDVRRLLILTAAPQGSLTGPVDPGDAQAVFWLEPTDTLRPWRRRKFPNEKPGPLTAEEWLCQQLVRLSTRIAHETHPRGGFLLHSGLALTPAELGEGGVIFAGRSGVGKSTTCRRLPPTWRALSDDVTLIARAADGSYRAHPWPTWSRFFGVERGDGSDRWDGQRAVPLRAIFVLEQGEDQIDPLGPGHAAALLTELALQPSAHYLNGKPLDEIAVFNRQQFENICGLVKVLPVYQLTLSLHGRFWDGILDVLAP